MSKQKRATPARSMTSEASGPRSGQPLQAPDPEVLPRPKRRTFTAAYKADILSQVDACAPGQIGVLLRREGLYSSHLTDWRRERESGGMNGLKPKKRGRKPSPDKKLLAENEKLRRQNQKLENELYKARTVIDVQKKVALLLGVETTSSEVES